MNTKKVFITLLIIIAIAMLGCTQTTPPTDTNNMQPTNNVLSDKNQSQSIWPTIVTKIEIYHFHRNTQCNSCITVGKYAEETLNTYFADELKTGKIVFGHINVQQPENEALANKYGATGSSLWIGVYDNKGFHAEQNVDVWSKIGNKQEYITYLKKLIEKRLAGDFS